jgi:hypothetical protein
MKTGPGRTEIYIPSPTTVSHDVRLVFARTLVRVARILQVKTINISAGKGFTKNLQGYGGKISFATDAWTSPNHTAYVTMTAHLEAKGEPISIVLNIIKVAKVLHHAVHNNRHG